MVRHQIDRHAIKADAAYLAAAKEALNRAKSLVVSGAEADLIYAALELRRALEALVYENALRFVDDLAATDFEEWRPPQLLERLLELDPVADTTMEMQMQDKDGTWISLGTDKRIPLSVLKKQYFALGNFLHTPTIAQVKNGRRVSTSKVLKRCQECIELIEAEVTASLRIDSFEIFGNTEFDCVECGIRLRRRLNALRTSNHQAPGTRPTITVECFNCLASYELRHDPERDIVCRELRWKAPCPMVGCAGVHVKWVREVKDDMTSDCSLCGERSKWVRVLVPIAVLPH